MAYILPRKSFPRKVIVFLFTTQYIPHFGVYRKLLDARWSFPHSSAQKRVIKWILIDSDMTSKDARSSSFAIHTILVEFAGVPTLYGRWHTSATKLVYWSLAMRYTVTFSTNQRNTSPLPAFQRKPRKTPLPFKLARRLSIFLES